MHGLVSSAKVSPLETVNRSQVPFLPLGEAYTIEELSRCIAIPDLDFLVTEQFGIGLSINKPDELLSYTPPKHILRSKHWETLAQVIPHLVTKLR